MINLISKEKGFTLAELLLTVGIGAMLMSTLGTAIFQAVSTQNKIIGDGLAINELRKGFIWFSKDIKMVQTTTLADGGTANVISASWTDQFEGIGTTHTVTYALVGGNLVRTYDGVSSTVGRRVTSAVFSRSGESIVAQIAVQVSSSVTRNLSVKAVMRAV